MARVPYLSKNDVAAGDQDLLARNLNLYNAVVHSPAGARAFAAPALYVRHDSPLDARLRELAIIQVGYHSSTRYEYAHHIEIGRNVGLSDADILAIAAETSGLPSHLNPLESAVLSAARELVDGTMLSDDVYAALSKELSSALIVDLVITICTYCGVVRLLGALQIDLEPEYEDLLEQFPLPGATNG